MKLKTLCLGFALLAFCVALAPASAVDRPDFEPRVKITDPPQDPAARQAMIDSLNLGGGNPAGGFSNCCFANGDVGCDNASCEATVCAADSFCCAVEWDSICASQALDLCGDLCKGYCCSAGPGTPGCTDDTCEATVCAVDSFCCDVSWDSICAEEAQHLCDVCITQAIPTVSKTGLGVLAAAMLLGGALLLRRRRTAS